MSEVFDRLIGYPKIILNKILEEKLFDLSSFVVILDFFGGKNSFDYFPKEIKEMRYFGQESDAHFDDDIITFSIKGLKLSHNYIYSFESTSSTRRRDKRDNFDFVDDYQIRSLFDKIREFNLVLFRSTYDDFFDGSTQFGLIKNDLENFLRAFKTEFRTPYEVESESKFYWDSFVKYLNFNNLSSNTFLDWNYDFISEYSEVWNWNDLHDNIAVPWSWRLIERNKNLVNWEKVTSNPNLNWNKENIHKYRNELIFSSNCHYQLDCIGYERDKYINYFENYHSRMDSGGYRPNSRSTKDLIGLSSKTFISWNAEIIDCVLDYWDWTELCLNPSIKWTEEFIERYFDRVDFKALSRNVEINWTIELISRFQDNFDWTILSGNKALPWNLNFIRKFKDRLLWQKFDHDDKYHHPSPYNYYPIYSCLITNQGINWNLRLIMEFKDQVDLWRLAKYGNIKNEVLIKFKKEFDERRVIGTQFLKTSDFRDETIIEYTGWENLSFNNSFFIEIEHINFFLENKTEIKYFKGNAMSGEEVYEKRNLIEILNNSKLSGISVNQIIKGEKWTNKFLNENFINDYLWEYVLKNEFNEETMNTFLMQLKKKMLECDQMLLAIYRKALELIDISDERISGIKSDKQWNKFFNESKDIISKTNYSYLTDYRYKVELIHLLRAVYRVWWVKSLANNLD